MTIAAVVTEVEPNVQVNCTVTIRIRLLAGDQFMPDFKH